MNELRIRNVDFGNGTIVVRFTDANQVRIPLRHFPRLKAVSPKQRTQWQLIGRGRGVHWPGIDEDLSVKNFLTAYSRSSKTRLSVA